MDIYLSFFLENNLKRPVPEPTPGASARGLKPKHLSAGWMSFGPLAVLMVIGGTKGSKTRSPFLGQSRSPIIFAGFTATHVLIHFFSEILRTIHQEQAQLANPHYYGAQK